MSNSTARRLYQIFEPYHALVYFAHEGKATYIEAGLRGYWMGYFASRAAPMGEVTAEVVTATFYNFAPSMVSRAIPDAWGLARRETVLRARHQLIDLALRRTLGDRVKSPELVEAAELARAAAQSCGIPGRPLMAGHLSLPWPQQPHLVLWHACSVLREHRGDGHIAALINFDLDGCESHVLKTGAGELDKSQIQPARGWTDAQWDLAAERLRQRGLLDPGRRATEQGRALHRQVEDLTDRLATGPWIHLGASRSDRLAQLLAPLSTAIVDSGDIPFPNPMGLPQMSSASGA
jgi:hypothetical protein